MISAISKLFAKYRLHVYIWTLYILYECVIVSLLFGEYGTSWVYFTHYTIIILLFYFHANSLLKLRLRRKYWDAWKLVLLVSVELIAYILICFGADKILENKHMLLDVRPFGFTRIYVLRNLYRCVYFIAFSTGYYFLITYNREKRINEELEKQRLTAIIQRQKAEQELTRAHNAFLKAQINPHFLFNTLDFIYHHIMEVSPAAADAIISLSEMMRFAIDADKRGEFIDIGEELEQVINLQYLNQIRKNETVVFNLSYSEDVRDLPFIPLVLLTLAENIFKHGDLSHGKAAYLKAYRNQDMLYIESENVSSHTKSASSKGDGLANIDKRLTFAYGSAVDFNYGMDDNGHFNVQIRVPVASLYETALPSTALVSIDKV